MNFDTINDETGFANGEQFTSEAQVRSYFTVENMREMFSGDCAQDTETLNEYAETVIENRWHCAF